MTQDEIIDMAMEAEFVSHGKPSYEESELFVCVDKDIVRFAKLVAAKEHKKWQDQTVVEIHEAILEEREVCAKVAEQSFGVIGSTIALAIRARTGEQA
jgi:hypothetical protein